MNKRLPESMMKIITKLSLTLLVIEIIFLIIIGVLCITTPSEIKVAPRQPITIYEYE